MQSQNKWFLFAPEWGELVQCIIFGALNTPALGAFIGMLLAAGGSLIGILSPSARILPGDGEGEAVLLNAVILCGLGGAAGIYVGAQIGIFAAILQFFLVAVWVPPGNWELVRAGYRRGMLYGALLGAACCAPLALLDQIDALTVGYSRSMLPGFREDYLGLCFILPVGGLLAGGFMAMIVAIARIRAGKEYRTPFPLPYPFHKW